MRCETVPCFRKYPTHPEPLRGRVQEGCLKITCPDVCSALRQLGGMILGYRWREREYQRYIPLHASIIVLNGSIPYQLAYHLLLSGFPRLNLEPHRAPRQLHRVIKDIFIRTIPCAPILYQNHPRAIEQQTAVCNGHIYFWFLP